MSTQTPSPGSSRFNWLWLVAVVAAFGLGRFGWCALDRASSAPPAGAATAAIPAESGPTHWVALADAEALAKRSGKPILYDFNAAWCPPCRALKTEVFSEAARAQQVETHVVPVTVVDRYREDGRNTPDVDALQQRFRVEALPTLVVLSPETGRFEKTEGYAGPEETLQWIARAAKSVNAAPH